MEIKVLEAGCNKCKILLQRTTDAAKQLGLENSIEVISDITEIAKYGVISLPALVVNGKVISTGKIPKVEQIIQRLQDEI